ncbi:MAG: hypothetical protein ACPG4N_11425, partial [Gammaproteobacteria bacterium]
STLAPAVCGRHWYPFATERVWYETQDIPMLDWLRFIEPWLNEGEAYEKMPRFIPYAALPLGVALLLIRLLQQAWHVITGKTDAIIASHEAEELMEELEMEAPHPTNDNNKQGA